MKNILLIITLLFTFASANAQTTVCLKNSTQLFIQSISLKYKVNSGNQEFEARKENGCFILDFPGFEPEDIETFTLIPQGDVEPLNCVSTFDMVLMRRHILGISEYQGTDLEYFAFLLASDVNNNGAVSTFDLVQLNQLILSVISDFPTNDSWRFLKLDVVQDMISDPLWNQNPWSPGIVWPWNLEYTSADLDTKINLLGIKVGDLNGACQ